MRVSQLIFAMLLISVRAWGGLIGVDYDPTLGKNQIRSIDPSTGSTHLLNSFTFSSGGWNPLTFSVNWQANALYAQSGDARLYTFNATTGAIVSSVPSNTSMQVLDVGAGGNLIGIDYNVQTMQNEIRMLNPSTGTTTLLNSFSFSSGGYYPDTFAVAPTLNRFYVQSANAMLYDFNLSNGQVLSTVTADTPMQALAFVNASDLIGIDYNPATMQNEVRRLNPSTGVTTLLNAFTFSSGGWNAGTLEADLAKGVFYAEAGDGTLYTFNLTTGAILNTKMLDTEMAAIEEGPISPVPEPSWAWAAGLLLPMLLPRRLIA